MSIALAEAGALYLSNLWLQTAGERISHELRIAVYDHLQRLSLAFHQKRQKGDLLTRVTGDVRTACQRALRGDPAGLIVVGRAYAEGRGAARNDAAVSRSRNNPSSGVRN